MQKRFFLCMLCGISLCITNMMFAQAPKNKDVAYFEVGKPVTISLSNKKAQGTWDINIKDDSKIQLNSKRNGYIFTYFTFTVLNDSVKNVTFTSVGNQERIFSLKPLHSLKPVLAQEIYGDIPSLSKSDGFLSQVNENPVEEISQEEKDTIIENKQQAPPVQKQIEEDAPSIQQKVEQQPIENNTQNQLIETPNKKEPGVNSVQNILPDNSAYTLNNDHKEILKDDSPQNISNNTNTATDNATELSVIKKETTNPLDLENTKIYIQNLTKNKLYSQALPVLKTLLEQNPSEKIWAQVQTLNINKNMQNYQEVVDNVDKYLQDNTYSPEQEVFIRIQKAQALYKLGKKQEAESEFLYLKSYFGNNPEVYAQIAQFYIGQKENDKAMQALVYITAQFPGYDNIDEVYYQLATIYYLSKDANGFNLALNYYKKVLGIGINSPFYTKAKSIVDFLQNNLLNYR